MDLRYTTVRPTRVCFNDVVASSITHVDTWRQSLDDVMFEYDTLN